MTHKRLSRSRGSTGEYQGVLVIGDPHVEGRQPGFRCDDYPRVILDKLRWCLGYAGERRLLPVLLGDLFERPRDNPTWMIGELIEMMRSIEIVGVFGNHDCAGITLDENDSLSILVKSGCLQLLSDQIPWIGEMNHRTVMIGGSSYRQRVPEKVDLPPNRTLLEQQPLVIWLTHHDVDLPGYEGGRFAPFEIENVDILINGHIHRGLAPVRRGQTMWITPGNISRRSRGEAIRNHTPSVLQIDIDSCQWSTTMVPVPHQPAECVFHEAVRSTGDRDAITSRFVDGLRELQFRRTDSGAGLHQFLDQNLVRYSMPVAKQIRELANLVTNSEAKRVSS